MVGGVGLFGSFAAYIGSLVVPDDSEHESRQHKADREMMRHLSRQIESLNAEVTSLRTLLEARDSEGATPRAPATRDKD